MRARMWTLPVLGVFISGCAAGPVGQAVVNKLTQPILGFAAEDAQTTVNWIDQQVKDGRLSTTDAAMARQCPQSVLDLAAYRDQMAAQKDVTGKKGLIYAATVLRYGAVVDVRQVREKVKLLIATCSELVPTEKLLTFGLAP